MLTARELYSLNSSLLAKHIFYHGLCLEKNRSACMLTCSPNGSSQFYSPEERKEKSCFQCACYLLFDPRYQQQDNWRRSDLLVEDFFLLVIKPPRTYFNNKLLPSCRSSKFSSSFPATSVLLCALLDPICPDRNYSKGDGKLF